MTDLDLPLNLSGPRLPKPAVALALLLAGCAVLFPLAAINTVLTTHESGYNDNPGLDLALVITALGLAALTSFAVVLRGDFRLNEDRERRGFVACIGLGILSSVLLLAVYSAGTWVPYLLHWDGLTVDDRVEGVELEVEGIILLQVFVGGVASLFVGSIAGFTAWLYQFARRFPEIAARLPWPWRIGLGVPLLLGLALALGVFISWLGDGYEPPEELNAGRVDESAMGAPKLYEEEDIWIVRLSEAEFVALYDRGVEGGCPLQWRRDHDFLDRTGWFVDACTGSAYDVTGRCASEVCRGTLLDRFGVHLQDGNVIVELEQVISTPSASQPAE